MSRDAETEHQRPEDAAMLVGAEVEHGTTEPTAGHHPRTEPVGSQEKKILDAAIRTTVTD